MFFRKKITSSLHFLFVAGSCLSLSNTLEAAWTTPVAISTDNSDQVDVALDTLGNAAIVWQGYDGTNYVIESSEKLVDGSWSIPLQLSDSGNDAQAPRVGLDKIGNSVVIWTRYDGTSSVVQGSNKPFGGTFSTPYNISNNTFNADSPDLSMDYYGTSGNALAVWHRYNGANFIVQASELPSLGSWSQPTNISPSGQDALIPKVAIDISGNAVATCARYDGTNFVSRSAMLLEGQNWSPSFVISNSGQSASAGSVDVDQYGNGMVAWSQSDGSNYLIMVSEIPYGGSLSTPITLSTPGESAYTPILHTSITTGDTIVVWIRFDGTNFRAEAIQKPKNGTWSSVTTLSNPGVNVANIQLAYNPTGKAVAVWDESDGVSSTIQSADYTSQTGWSSIQSVSTSGAFAYQPVIDMDNSGNGVAAWLQQVDGIYNVYSATLPAVN